MIGSPFEPGNRRVTTVSAAAFRRPLSSADDHVGHRIPLFNNLTPQTLGAPPMTSPLRRILSLAMLAILTTRCADSGSTGQPRPGLHRPYTISQRQVGEALRKGERVERSGFLRVLFPGRSTAHDVSFVIHQQIQKGEGDENIVVTDATTGVVSTFALDDEAGVATISISGAQVPIAFNPDGTFTVDGRIQPTQEAIAQVIATHPALREVSPETYVALHEALGIVLPSTSKGAVIAAVEIAMTIYEITMLIIDLTADEPSPVLPRHDTTSLFVSRLNKKCMDVPDANFSNGNQIQMWGCNGTTAQQWTFVGNTLRVGGKCLDVTDGASSNGTPIRLWDCVGNPAQVFTRTLEGKLMNPLTNKCVDIQGGSTADGARLHLWDCLDVPSQKWDLGGAPFVSHLNNKCMDVPYADFSNGNQIQMLTCKGNHAQRWTLVGNNVHIGGKCLDVADGSANNGTPIRLWDCNDTAAQHFTLTASGTLRSELAGNKCVDIQNGSAADGARLHLWDCLGVPSQKWTFGPTGRAALVSRLNNKCMDVPYADFSNGKPIQMLGCNGNDAQQWTFVGDTLRVGGKCLDVTDGSSANGAPIRLWECNGTPAQNFTLNAEGKLLNPLTSKCVDIQDGSAADGARLHLWDCLGVPSQKWTFGPTVDATFLSPFNNKCMDVPEANFSNGNQLQMWSCNGTAAQQWVSVGNTLRAGGKCLDVAEGSANNGTPIRLWECNGTPAQDFTLNAEGKLINPRTNKCVDIQNGSAAEGAKLHLWDCLNVPTQKWIHR
jgi:hypothetical protein